MDERLGQDGRETLPLSSNPFDTIPALVNALDVMQEQYFELWQGTWPTSIDWTAAVLGSHVSATLGTLSAAVEYVVVPETSLSNANAAHENLINEYFSQLIGSYFGQEAFRLRNEAYDDMLWVVLSWLDSIKFIQMHSDLHYQEPRRPSTGANSKRHSAWYGKQWIPSFAHRARLFWDLASKGWNTTLCGGGMIWSPWLLPYKNAITNELFITASISMYLYFPGDDNTSPFAASAEIPVVGPRDPKYLQAAIDGYKWLSDSNMKNDQGLYVDGYHISGWKPHQNDSEGHTTCDERNEMVYTYNQGVLLSGQRGLWEATGSVSYLEDGHKLVSDVINATGYNLKHDRIYDNDDRDFYPHLAKWHGMGRLGIMEEACDAFAYCSQNGQTFKGIFFHHLSLFCAALPPHTLEPGETFDVREFQEVQEWHAQNCARYGKWIKRNAEAAMSTRDDKGRFGEWWGAPVGKEPGDSSPNVELPDQAIDYRNEGVPDDATWKDNNCTSRPCEHNPVYERPMIPSKLWNVETKDANDRGRGRTVETQSGGIAILRALWELVEIPGMNDD